MRHSVRHEPVLEVPPRRSACRGSRWCRWRGLRSCRPPSCVNSKPCPSPRGFGTTNRDRPRCALDRSGSVRASSISTSARAPNVHQVFTPLIFQPGSPPGPVVARRHLDAGDVRPEVRLGDRDRHHRRAVGELREPLVLLLLGATLHEGAGEDLGTGDQRAADAERTAAQLLGGDDHAHVVALAARGEAAVLLGHRQPEAAHLGQTGDHVLGDVGVRAVDVLGDGLASLSSANRRNVSPHELEVGVEVARSLLAGEVGEEVGVAIRGEERTGWVERAGLDAPTALRGRAPAPPRRARRRRRTRRRCGLRRRPSRRSRGAIAAISTAAAAWARS